MCLRLWKPHLPIFPINTPGFPRERELEKLQFSLGFLLVSLAFSSSFVLNIEREREREIITIIDSESQ